MKQLVWLEPYLTVVYSSILLQRGMGELEDYYSSPIQQSSIVIYLWEKLFKGEGFLLEMGPTPGNFLSDYNNAYRIINIDIVVLMIF